MYMLFDDISSFSHHCAPHFRTAAVKNTSNSSLLYPIKMDEMQAVVANEEIIADRVDYDGKTQVGMCFESIHFIATE